MSVLVGKKAPLFEADAVINGEEIIEKFSLSQYIGRKHVVFFFYPLDFTEVSPTEILAFQNKLPEFEARNVAVVGCSVDSAYSHHAWLKVDRDQGGIKGVTFPLVSDLSKTITENYDVMAGTYEYDEEDNRMDFDGNPVAYSGLFIIDKQGIVRHQVINDLPLGRSIDETLRMIDAIQYFEETGELPPADWHKGDPGIKTDNEGVV
jgi:peroxiredoxin (alkyl hydroperoxide reductase subunit C)